MSAEIVGSRKMSVRLEPVNADNTFQQAFEPTRQKLKWQMVKIIAAVDRLEFPKSDAHESFRSLHF